MTKKKPETSRIDIIGHNGNDGEHYDGGLGPTRIRKGPKGAARKNSYVESGGFHEVKKKYNRAREKWTWTHEELEDS